MSQSNGPSDAWCADLMWPYWVMFLVPAFAAGLSPASGLQDSFSHSDRGQPALPWGAIWLATALLIGLRDEVGGDWGNYFRYLSDCRRSRSG